MKKVHKNYDVDLHDISRHRFITLRQKKKKKSRHVSSVKPSSQNDKRNIATVFTATWQKAINLKRRAPRHPDGIKSDR